MISNKKELKYYLECDKVALSKHTSKPKLFGDEIWKFEVCMRKLEYYCNANKILKWYYHYRYHYLSIKLGFDLPFNVFGPGLAIVHYGNIIVSPNAMIGNNCRIHSGVNIGANRGEEEAAIIGNNVYIGPGAIIIGAVKIGDNSVIGAGAVVTKSIPPSVTVAGVPAKVISNKDSSMHLVKATDIVKRMENNEQLI